MVEEKLKDGKKKKKIRLKERNSDEQEREKKRKEEGFDGKSLEKNHLSSSFF